MYIKSKQSSNKQKHVVRSRKYGERKYLGTAAITNEVQSEFMFMLQNFPPRAHHRTETI